MLWELYAHIDLTYNIHISTLRSLSPPRKDEGHLIETNDWNRQKSISPTGGSECYQDCVRPHTSCSSPKHSSPSLPPCNNANGSLLQRGLCPPAHLRDPVSCRSQLMEETFHLQVLLVPERNCEAERENLIKSTIIE